MTIRFGLLGAGRIGKVHAKAVTGNPAAKLVAVSDAMPAAAEAIADAVWLRGALDCRRSRRPRTSTPW